MRPISVLNLQELLAKDYDCELPYSSLQHALAQLAEANRAKKVGRGIWEPVVAAAPPSPRPVPLEPYDDDQGNPDADRLR